VLTIVLDLLADYGVDDVEIIIATSVHRRMKPFEVRHMVGDRIFDAYWPRRLYNHDAENLQNMKLVGTTDEGEEVELNRRAVESDLVIYVNLNLVPMDGGHKSVAVGLCGYRSLRAHHNPKTMRDCWSYMDPAKSALNASVERMGRSSSSRRTRTTSRRRRRARSGRSASRCRRCRSPRGRRSSSACRRRTA
jgi:nickel-dependent lactate racemase